MKTLQNNLLQVIFLGVMVVTLVVMLVQSVLKYGCDFPG